MSGIGQQGETAGVQPADDLGDEDQTRQRDGDPQWPDVPMLMDMDMARTMMVMMSMMIVMIMIVRRCHAKGINRDTS